MAIEQILGHDVEVIRFDSNEEHTKAVIKRRLDFAAEKLEMDIEKLIQIDDSGYKAICDVSQNSVGLALETTNLAMNYLERQGRGPPYVITSDVIKEMGLTYESLCEWWDNPMRKATVIHIKGPGE